MSETDCSNIDDSRKDFLHRLLESAWYGHSFFKYLLLPLVPVYCLLARYRRWLHTCRRPSENKLPIIVVGNITVGGTGKTPLVIYLAELLMQAGYKPGIVSRGYKGKAEEWPQKVTSASHPKLVGDEPSLIASRTQCPVVVGPDRNTDIKSLLNTYDCDVIISDDGLQHYLMPRSIEVAMVDGNRRFGNGWCLPAGPLREAKKRLDEVDFVVVNNGNDDDEFTMKLSGQSVLSLNSSDNISLHDLSGNKVHAVSGIGNPERFFKLLEKYGLELICHSFSDHHVFEKEDLCFDDQLPVIITEKDAVKCKGFSIDNCWYLPVEAKVNNDFGNKLIKKLEAEIKEING
jgi:tetraacyldisaccharide 4'-kinase